MIIYTKRSVVFISLCFTLLFYFLGSFTISFCVNQFSHSEIHVGIRHSFIQNIEPMIEEVEELKWQIRIPAINLEAPIGEDTTKETMDKYVGHFVETSVWEGNVGLAGHNRRCIVNYFERLKELRKGDTIEYETQYGKREYEVDVITIIEDTDWSYLENTEDNKITLITCVEDMPNLRRVIQGREF